MELASGVVARRATQQDLGGAVSWFPVSVWLGFMKRPVDIPWYITLSHVMSQKVTSQPD